VVKLEGLAQGAPISQLRTSPVVVHVAKGKSLRKAQLGPVQVNE
jgi:hypothetical protein